MKGHGEGPAGFCHAILRGLDDVTCWGVIATDAKLTVTGWNPWLEQAGVPAADVVGRNLLEAFPDLVTRRLDRCYRQALGGHSVVLSQRLHEYLIPLPPTVKGAGLAHMRQSARIAPLTEGKAVIGTITVIEDVTERVVYEAELRARARQQATLALLGRRALQGGEITALGAEVVAAVADTLRADHAHLLEVSDGGPAVLRAAAGAGGGPVGSAEPAGPGTYVTAVLDSPTPVVIAGPGSPVPSVLGRPPHAGVGVRVGTGERPFGVLGVFSAAPRVFDDDEVHFLQAAAQLLGLAVERKHFEERLREHAEQLADADRRKDEFLAMLAHELRNPLAPIRTSIQVLRMKGPPDPDLDLSRDVIDRQVHQLTRLVDDLLDVSRITRGKINLRMEPVDLAVIVARAVEMTRPAIDTHRHALTVALPPEPLWVEADAARLTQVVANLISNAAKYTPDGGRIGVTVERAGEELTLAVRDSGIGISAEMLPKVFDLFTQLNRSLDRSEGGLGVGLTLVRRLVQLHGGSVEAHSEGPGKGSEFVIRLPAAAGPKVSPAPAPGAAGGEAGPSRRILVVDDNRDAADTLALLLSVTGHRVRTAYSGRDALEEFRKEIPEVVFLDIGLPGMSGHEVARQLREQHAARGVLIIALTGYGQEEDRRLSREAGFDHHLVKPIDPAVLQNILARLPARDSKGLNGEIL